LGWSALKNGDLLDAAEQKFDALITTSESSLSAKSHWPSLGYSGVAVRKLAKVAA
jgi:hypothetical protein